MDAGDLAEVPIDIDSPMAVDATAIYSRHLHDHSLDARPWSACSPPRALLPHRARVQDAQRPGGPPGDHRQQRHDDRRPHPAPPHAPPRRSRQPDPAGGLSGRRHARPGPAGRRADLAHPRRGVARELPRRDRSTACPATATGRTCCAGWAPPPACRGARSWCTASCNSRRSSPSACRPRPAPRFWCRNWMNGSRSDARPAGCMVWSSPVLSTVR